MLDTIFTDEVMEDFKKEISKLRKAKTKKPVFNKNILNAFDDILECIEKGSLKTADDVDDYVEEYYSTNENDYFIICSMVQFADGEFDTVKELFDAGSKLQAEEFDDFGDEGFVFELDEDEDF